MEPASAIANGLEDKLKGRFVAPEEGKITCDAGASGSRIDYFFMTGGLNRGVNDIEVLRTRTIKTHRPVAVTFAPQMAALRRRCYKETSSHAA